MPFARKLAIVAAAAMAATGLIGVSSASAGAACDVTGVTLTDGSLSTDLHNTACGDEWYVLNLDNSHGDTYLVTSVRDAGAKAYHVSVTPVGGAAFSTSQEFHFTFATGGDVVRVASGRAEFVDVGLADPGYVHLTASPVTATVCTPAGGPTCATGLHLESDLSFDSQYADITATKWSSPADSYSLASACPVTSHAGDALGVTMTLQGPALDDSTGANLVDSLLVLPKSSTNGCFGVDPDVLAAGLVVLADNTRIASVVAPSGAAQYGVPDSSDCGGACIALSQVGFVGGAAHTYVVAYAYKSQTATAWARSYLKKPSTKAAGTTKKNTRNWAITLKPGSSPACVQNGTAVSALRTSAMGAHVTCKYTMSYQRKAGNGKWKTKRVGGAFVA